MVCCPPPLSFHSIVLSIWYIIISDSGGYLQPPYAALGSHYQSMIDDDHSHLLKKSKRKRKTNPRQREAANVRERRRMTSLNVAFDKLRKVS